LGRSWGHAIRRLTDDEIAFVRARHAWWIAKYPDWPYRPGTACRTGKCDEDATHAVSYSYVTGRSGRVTWAEKRVCGGHAEKFRVKHDLPEAETLPGQVHAADLAVRTMLDRDQGDKR
jgi:hypothetical protein